MFLISAIDRKHSPLSNNYTYVLLDNNSSIITREYDSVETNLNTVLKKIHDEYIKYDFDFVKRINLNVEFIPEDNIVELTYLTTFNYMPGFFKSGRVYTFQEIDERGIQFDEHRRRDIARYSGIPIPR